MSNDCIDHARAGVGKNSKSWAEDGLRNLLVICLALPHAHGTFWDSACAGVAIYSHGQAVLPSATAAQSRWRGTLISSCARPAFSSCSNERTTARNPNGAKCRPLPCTVPNCPRGHSSRRGNSNAFRSPAVVSGLLKMGAACAAWQVRRNSIP
jgi:hypothetical protein